MLLSKFCVYGFWEFDYNVSGYGFYGVYHAWSLLSFLDVYIYGLGFFFFFNQIWGISGHDSWKLSLSFPSASVCKYICWCLTGLSSSVHFSLFSFCSLEYIISVELFASQCLYFAYLNKLLNPLTNFSLQFLYFAAPKVLYGFL